MSATLAPLVPALDDAARRGTGCLNVTGPRAGQQAQIYFDDGLVYATHVDTFTPLIGRRLLSIGALTGDQYATLLARLNGNEADPAIGMHAVKAGYFRQDVLDSVLVEVLTAAFMDVLSWPTPSTKWKRRARTNHLVAPATQITTLLQSARRRTTQWHARWEAIGHNPALVRPLATGHEHDDDPDGLSRLISSADGTLDLLTISDRCGLTYFEAGTSFLDLHDEGLVTFLLPTTTPVKDPSMQPAVPVAPPVDTVPGLPLPPLPNFDGQTLPPAPDAAAAAAPSPQPSDSTDVPGESTHAPLPTDAPAVQPVVAVHFDVDQAAAVVAQDGLHDAAPDHAPDAAPDAAPDEAPQGDAGTEAADEAADEAAGVYEGDAQPDAVPVPSSEDADPRASAQRALLADELDAAAEAVRFAEGTIARLTAEEEAHHAAAEQALVHQQRYEAFLLASETEAERLKAEQDAAAAEAAALAATADELTANRAALEEALALVEEQAVAAQRELEEAQRKHDLAMLELAQAKEASTELTVMLDDMHAAAEANHTLTSRIAEDLDVANDRGRTYAREIEDARQSAADLAEAAQASARLRERAEQRLAAAQATLSTKASQLNG